MAIVETMSLILTGAETFVTSGGKMLKKGEIYTFSKEDAMKLMAVKGDYDMRFFKRHEGEQGVKAAPVDLEKKSIIPSQEEVANDMVKDTKERTEATRKAHLADVAATSSRGNESAEEAGLIKDTGEMDTATQPAKARGKHAVAV